MTNSNTEMRAVAQEAIAYALVSIDGGFFFNHFEKEAISDLEGLIINHLEGYPDPVIHRFSRQYLAPLKAIETNGLSALKGDLSSDWAVQVRTDTLDAMNQERKRQHITFLMLLSTKSKMEETQLLAG